MTFAFRMGRRTGIPKSEFYPARSCLACDLVRRRDDTRAAAGRQHPVHHRSRPCDLAGCACLTVCSPGRGTGSHYSDRRASSFIVVASAGRRRHVFLHLDGHGPGSRTGSMPAMTGADRAHVVWRAQYLVRVGSEREPRSPRKPAVRRLSQRLRRPGHRARRGRPRIERKLDASNVRRLLANNWGIRGGMTSPVAVLPVQLHAGLPYVLLRRRADTTTVDGAVERHRQWNSCFDLAHSLVHTGRFGYDVVALSTVAHPQALDVARQFGSSLRRCVVASRGVRGIDITVEVAAIARATGCSVYMNREATGHDREHW